MTHIGIEVEWLDATRDRVKRLYDKHVDDVPFHGWHHIEFVVAKVPRFARELNANVRLTLLAALTHDVNHVVSPGSEVRSGLDLLRSVLTESGCPPAVVDLVQAIVTQAETAHRGPSIGPEAMALSDADTLFKALPITPILLAPRYMEEAKWSVETLAHKIISEQSPLERSGIYFYSAAGKTDYDDWARVNLALWRGVLRCLEDPDVARLERQLRR